MDLNRAEQLFDALASIVDYPLCDQPRDRLSATLAVSSLQFAAAARVLCVEGLLLGSSVTLRSQFEALLRSIWVFHKATDSQIERLSADLNLETQQASKNIPMANEMLLELEKIPVLKNLIIPLNEFKSSSWLPLNSYVHSGIHAVHWTKHGAPPQLLDTNFRASNGLSVLAFMAIGILTRRPNLQSEIIATSLNFSTVLPRLR